MALAALTACATTTPVPTPCVTQLPAKPVYLMDRLPVDASHAEVARAMAADLIMAATYIDTLHSIMEACYVR